MDDLLKVTQVLRSRIRAGTLTAALHSSFSWALSSESKALLHPGCPEPLLQEASEWSAPEISHVPFSLWRTGKMSSGEQDWGASPRLGEALLWMRKPKTQATGREQSGGVISGAAGRLPEKHEATCWLMPENSLTWDSTFSFTVESKT